MENFETLRSISEIAITLTGFTGIVVVFGQRSGGVWNPLEWVRLRMLLETSIGVLFLALVPILIGQLEVPDSVLWKTSNGLQALVHLSGIIVLYFRIRRLESKYWPREEKILLIVLLPVSFAIIMAHILVCLGILDRFSVFIYLAGLFYLMLLSAIHFLLLLIPDDGKSTDNDQE